MAVEIATAYVNIVPYARGFGRQLANALGYEVTAASKAMGGSASAGFGSTFLPGVSAVAKTAAVAIGAAMAATTAWGIKTAASNEQALISFEALLGSAEKGQKMFADLRDFAKRTPFEFPDLQQSASRMLAMGFSAEKIIPILTTLGNATTATGTGADGIRRATIALQQMQAAGRIFAQDLNQLRDAGIPVFDLLAGATGKTKEELANMARKGQLGKKELDQLMAALESGKGLEKFNGLMEKMNLSLKGQWSNLKDELGQGLAEAFAPALPAIKQTMSAFAKLANTTLAAVGPHIAKIFDQLVRLVGDLMPIVAPMIDALTTVIGAFVDALEPALRVLMPILTQVVHIIAGALTMALQGIAPTLRDLVAAVGPVLVVVARVAGTGFVILISMINELVKALTPAIDLIADEFINAVVDTIPLWLDLARALIPLMPELAKLAIALAPLVALFLTFETKLMAKLLPILIPIVDKFAQWASVMVDELVPAIERAVGWITRFFDALFKEDAGAMADVTNEASDFINKRLGELTGFLWKGFDWLFTEFEKWWDATAWPWIKQKAAEMGDWFSGWLKEQTDKLPVQLQVATDALIRWIETEGLKQIGKVMMAVGDAITNAFIGAFNAVIHAWNGLHFAEIKVGDKTVFEGFTPPQVSDIPEIHSFAKGGRPSTTEPSLVGEVGPELFWPDSAGTIVPHNQLTGGFNIEHFEVHGADQPEKTAFDVRKELRWLSMTAGGM